MSFSIQAIQQQLQQQLPGPEAQYKMAHVVRQNYLDLKPDVPVNARIACVLALLYPKLEEDMHIVLIERISSNPKDRHKGQVSFPGGRYEDEDGTFERGALREAQEEVGVDPDRISILGPLTELYIPVSNFKVYPFVGYVDERPSFRPQLSEVKQIIEVPIEHLTNPATRQFTNIRINEQITLNRVPFYNVQGKIVWGATAMILSELITVLHASRHRSKS